MKTEQRLFRMQWPTFGSALTPLLNPFCLLSYKQVCDDLIPTTGPHTQTQAYWIYEHLLIGVYILTKIN